MVSEFFGDETGATLVEYGVVLLVAIGVGGVALTSLTAQTQTNFQTMCEQIAIEQVGAEGCDIEEEE